MFGLFGKNITFKVKTVGDWRKPWSSGYGKRLTFRRSWVRIPAPYTGWTFFPHIFVVCLKRPKINEKEAGVGPFFKKTVGATFWQLLGTLGYF